MKVGVIMGGISSEREISLKSGNAVLENIDRNKYDVVKIVLDEKEDIITKVKEAKIDFALLALHGQFGEDGTVQSVLKTLDIPYSGCNHLSSALCMDKDMAKRILKFGNVRTANWSMAKSVETINYAEIEKMGYPVFIKPNSGGSSVATNFIKRKEDVEAAVVEALKYDTEVMIEEYIKGDEITCPIMGERLFPVVAIRPKGEFFDVVAKYSSGDDAAEEFIIELEENLHKEVEQMAFETYKLLKCSVYARVDMIISNGVPYILEVNTLPGMTETSLFPRSVAGAGIDYTSFIDLIIEGSLKEIR
ncbi:D-alanine--D-alanine ligase [uncultured Clostridium sp.]|jgi:D-alanine-D-alanine ligase|uniref:D-alanine--D-alanine ligase n=1 Tax=uncultured Clostridium sp. TaxID=59620 RepID=UPI00261D0D6A|nr:D-alanine--D-alanine ligase [uncultured Clostridium sp.]